MSLNKFTTTAKGQALGLNVGAALVNTTQLISGNTDSSITSARSNNSIISGENASIAGNSLNSTIVSGRYCTINPTGSSQCNVILGGNVNAITGDVTNESTIINGADNIINVSGATIIGGSGCSITGDYSAILNTYDVSCANRYCLISGTGTPAALTSGDYQLNFTYAGGYSLFSNSARTTGMTMGVSASAWAAVSDIRKKKNITPYTENACDKLKEVKVIKYHYNHQEDDEKLKLGLSAQNLQRVYPEYVQVDETTEDKFLSVEYSNMTVPLIKAVQELTARVEKLESLLKN
jgi:hypothetical protein